MEEMLKGVELCSLSLQGCGTYANDENSKLAAERPVSQRSVIVRERRKVNQLKLQEDYLSKEKGK